jgi:hypothetical protein
MKKAKFTLGLMLSVLFMGANVMNAAHDISKPHYGSINVTLSAKASEFYGGTGITFKQVATDPNGEYHYSFYKELWPSFLPIGKDFGPQTQKTWNYGSVTKGNADFFINENKGDTTKYLNYYYDTKQTTGNHLAGLFYYQTKSQTTAYNELQVQLKYENGNELTPVIKRTITLGEWVLQGDPDPKKNDPVRNELNVTNITIIDFLEPTDFWYLTDMDRGTTTGVTTGVATYVYKEDMLAMLAKYPIIKSIKYEISLHDEVGTPDEGEYQPPVYVDKTALRGLTINANDGITTNLSAAKTDNDDNMIVYVPSQKDFVFTAYCDEEIEVTTDRGIENDAIKEGGNGVYTITIRKVQFNFNIYLKKAVTPESGAGGDNDETANATITGDAVWAAGGTLYIQAANAGSLAIYNITGQLYKAETISGSYTLSMPKGLYIVQLNGKAYKVVL